ncbi:MAG: hypothetical protein QOD70_2630 [Frankiales bacterium]|jgi:hypothetical protein|nr:hypothetical protein [Frankiales bacterium]MDX6218324.1 hypothetical protein [Frankiales bacterium]MDX6267890.1 hypothetical protein [Frankiales bacterium]
MTRRLFYIALGATAGVLLVRKLSQTAERLAPPKLVGGALDNLSDAIRQFGADVREGMTERESELREGLGLDDAV